MSQPRVISGKAKGRRLKAVPGDITRPITDKVKGALFNMLGADIAGSIFLDLFGGTGSVGIEALSRGAHYAVFVDKNRAAYMVIKENLAASQLDETAQVFMIDALRFLQKDPDRQFDYIFIAPPQYKGLWKETMMKLEANPDWLHPDGSVIVQIDILEYEKLELQTLNEVEQRRYGDTLLVFYERP
jgi:16S rRNA (guanine966-N2)-methyltransferase